VADFPVSDRGEAELLMRAYRYFLPVVLLVGVIRFAEADGMSIVDGKNVSLDLEIRTIFIDEVDFNSGDNDVRIESAKIGLDGEIDDWLDFTVSAETVRGIEPGDPYSFVLDDAVIGHRFFDFLKVELGLQRPPYGFESFLGPDERPYIDRMHTSSDLCPGKDIGLVFSGKKILDIVGYGIGVFYGTSDLPVDSTLSGLAAGKIFARFGVPDVVDAIIGYNGFYHYFVHDVPVHRIAQGGFVALEWTPVKDQVLGFLAEYEERLETRNVINQNLDWMRGFFGMLSYRIGMVEPFVTCEVFDESLLVSDDHDILSIDVGSAAYFLKKDKLRVKLAYTFEQPLGESRSASHGIALAVQMEL
jgi:hypothetical protein